MGSAVTRARTCRPPRTPRSRWDHRGRRAPCRIRCRSDRSPSCRFLAGAAGRARVLLPLLRERQRAKDVLLRVRVVEHVDRERADRLLVAVAREDLVDATVAVPVRHDLLRARLRLRARGGRGRPARSARQARAARRERGCDGSGRLSQGSARTTTQGVFPSGIDRRSRKGKRCVRHRSRQPPRVLGAPGTVLASPRSCTRPRDPRSQPDALRRQRSPWPSGRFSSPRRSEAEARPSRRSTRSASPRSWPRRPVWPWRSKGGSRSRSSIAPGSPCSSPRRRLPPGPAHRLHGRSRETGRGNGSIGASSTSPFWRSASSPGPAEAPAGSRRRWRSCWGLRSAGRCSGSRSPRSPSRETGSRDSRSPSASGTPSRCSPTPRSFSGSGPRAVAGSSAASAAPCSSTGRPSSCCSPSPAPAWSARSQWSGSGSSCPTTGWWMHCGSRCSSRPGCSSPAGRSRARRSSRTGPSAATASPTAAGSPCSRSPARSSWQRSPGEPRSPVSWRSRVGASARRCWDSACSAPSQRCSGSSRRWAIPSAGRPRSSRAASAPTTPGVSPTCARTTVSRGGERRWRWRRTVPSADPAPGRSSSRGAGTATTPPP